MNRDSQSDNLETVASDHVLIDSDFKTQRAKQHLEQLKTAIGDFLQDSPCTVSIDKDIENNVIRYKAIFKQPHVSTYLIAGDVFQCLRTALDQAVWWFASQNHSDPEWTQFPIFPVENKKNKDKFDIFTKGVPDRAKAIIESLQPYNRPNGALLSDNLLWQLNEINRIDKHRRISVFSTAAQIEAHVDATTIAMENGYEVIVPGTAEPAFEPIFTPMVLFGDSRGITMQIDGIERIHALVAEVILPRLAGCV